MRQADGDAPELPATTHLSIVDQAGNAVALDQFDRGGVFGSRIQVEGFLLNNQLTDFSLLRESTGATCRKSCRSRQAGPCRRCRPRWYSMPRARLLAVLGSPGGSRIINYVARTLLALLDGDMEVAAALQLGHVGNRNGDTEVELDRVDIGTRRQLEALGHRVRELDMTSGLHVIVRRNGIWTGAADPRREGQARGG
jgi:gamma-glutamyltranspeptidase/glutathione hydrolase